MISGLRKDSVPHRDEEKRLSWWIQEDFPFYINPIPNLYFTRDPGRRHRQRYGLKQYENSGPEKGNLPVEPDQASSPALFVS